MPNQCDNVLFFLSGLAGKVENRSDTMILFTQDTKPFICLLLKVVFAIYLFKVRFKGYQIQVGCINRIKVQRAVLQHSLLKPRTVTPSRDCSGAWVFGQLCQLRIFDPVVFNYGWIFEKQAVPTSINSCLHKL